MILNVSSRTDIIAFYEKWLIKRVEAGFVDVRNPFNLGGYTGTFLSSKMLI